MVSDLSDTQIFRRLEGELCAPFIGREEEARVAILALLTKQHASLVGEPGVAKSAMLRRLARLVDGKYFYYLMSKYTVPDELVGPIDPVAYRQGQFKRMRQGRLTEANIAFIDEIWKASSETLNTLLSIANERVFVDSDGTEYVCPIWSIFGASNEYPRDSELAAFYDRFLLRHYVRRIDASLIEKAVAHNLSQTEAPKPVVALEQLNQIYGEVEAYMLKNVSAIARTTSQLVITLRQNGIFISDRTAVSPNHLPRLIATYSYVYNCDLRKAAISVSKYVLPNEEALEAYRNALDTLMPVELREAQEKLDRARDHAASGRLPEAKRSAAEAIQAAQGLFGKPEKVELFKDEVKEIIGQAEKLVAEIEKIEQQLKAFRKGD
jgi:MoxR-like ATPase